LERDAAAPGTIRVRGQPEPRVLFVAGNGTVVFLLWLLGNLLTSFDPRLNLRQSFHRFNAQACALFGLPEITVMML